ncbi:MAG TPA: hypothetical protein VJY54_05825 [Lachnospiraceae bacterium]|nr:hypothetical protein [Lachnospiraceae bacterium]
MAHMTRKKRKKRDKDLRSRVSSGFNTGTRDMGFESNNERKDQLHKTLSSI